MYFDFNLQIALELTPELPNESDLNRWCGEPVHLIIIPSDLFKTLKNNSGVYLDDHLESVCLKFLQKTETHYAVRCNLDDPWMNQYATYLRRLTSRIITPYHVYVDLFISVNRVNTINLHGFFATVFLSFLDVIRSTGVSTRLD